MNKKLRLISSAAIATACIFSYIEAALAATATGNASARVVQAISIVPLTTLAFGDVVVTGGAETVTIAPDGNLSGSLTPTGSPTAGVFTVDGEDLKTYAVTVPASATLNSGGDSITVDTFTYNGGGGVGSPGVVTNGGGPLNIGATLQVGGAQPGGSYAGTYNVSVDYN